MFFSPSVLTKDTTGVPICNLFCVGMGSDVVFACDRLCLAAPLISLSADGPTSDDS